MNSIIICHLSDIHFNSRSANNMIMNRVEQIGQAIISKCIGINDCIILVSGDIAFSGSHDDYDIACSFFNELEVNLKSKINTVEFIFVPGNHDCFIDKEDSIRPMIIQNILKDDNITLKLDQLNHCTKVQENYNAFIKDYGITPFIQKLNNFYEIQLDNKKIMINLINTAWMSVLKQEPNSISMPSSLLETISDVINYDLVISVFHHPYCWLREASKRNFRQYIENTSDLVFTGHEHNSDEFQLKKKDCNFEYFSGGVLQEPGNNNYSEFSTIIIDFESSKMFFEKYEWCKINKHYVSLVNFEKDFKKNNALEKNRFIYNEKFNEQLNDLGLSLYKGINANINLDDVFVYPNLKIVCTTDKEWKDEILSETNILNKIYEEKVVLISGDESSGKTIFARRLFKDVHKTSKIPLLVSGDIFVTFEVQSVLKIIKSKFSEQYSEDLYEKYIQVDKENKIIIIDDIHGCKLNSDGLRILLDVITDIFGCTILFCNEKYRINKFMDKNTAVSYSEIYSCAIMPLSCKKRDELIERWILTGQEYLIEKEDLNEECINKGNLVDNIIGTGWIPSYPGYILLILQQLEVNNSIDTQMSSHGYLYQFMINRQLSRTGKTPQEINILDEILINVAGYMFKRDAYQISELEIEGILKEYNSLYRMNQDSRTIERLIEGRLLDVKNGYYLFKHKYIFYYFTAQFLHANKHREEIKNSIYALCSKLYSEKYANILIFLCHISKDREIIEEIIYRSFEVFDGIESYDFLNHKKFIASVNTGLKTMLLPDTGVDQNRKEMLQKREALERELNHIDTYGEQAATKEEDDEKNEPIEIMLFNKAIKTLEIMGQILKNYPGSLTGDIKKELIMECHNLSMRTLNVFLIFYDKAIEEGFLEEILNFEDEENKSLTNQEKLQLIEEYRMRFVRIAENIATSFIAKTAVSIGDKILKESYIEIFSEHKDVVSYKLLEIAIQLFCFNNIPYQEIIKTSYIFKKSKNYFSFEILRNFVGHFLYLHGCSDISIKQRLCAEMEIDSKNLLFSQRKQA